MAHDPLLRWEWEGGAPAHPDWPDWDRPDWDRPDWDRPDWDRADSDGPDSDRADSDGLVSDADEASKGADVEGRDPARPDRLRSRR
jgi:hypothetical protein